MKALVDRIKPELEIQIQIGFIGCFDTIPEPSLGESRDRAACDCYKKEKNECEYR